MPRADTELDTVQYRIAQPTDVPAIQSAAAESWQATYQHIHTPEYIANFLATRYSEGFLLEMIANPQARFLVACQGPRVVGFCYFGESSHGAELFRFYVVPDYWRRGIGSQLLRLMEQCWQEHGIAAYRCFVYGRNEIGKSFYLKNNFVHDPAHDEADEWCMRKKISEVR